MTTTTEAPRLVKPIQCRRCSGTGFVRSHVAYCGVPGTCFKCSGLGTVEGDRPTIAAAKARTERRIAAAKIIFTGDLGHGDLTNATARERLDAMDFRAAVRYGFDTLEANDPERFAKAVDSVLAGHPAVFEALAAYGKDA